MMKARRSKKRVILTSLKWGEGWSRCSIYISDLGSLILILIQITPKERNLNIADNDSVRNFTQHAMKNVCVGLHGARGFCGQDSILALPAKENIFGVDGSS